MKRHWGQEVVVRQARRIFASSSRDLSHKYLRRRYSSAAWACLLRIVLLFVVRCPLPPRLRRIPDHCYSSLCSRLVQVEAVDWRQHRALALVVRHRLVVRH